MPLIHVTRGLPGSGKTTWALEQLDQNPTWVRANRDTIRTAMFSETNKWRPSKEKKVSQQECNIVESALSMGRSVIIDDTNLSNRTMATWNGIANKYHVTLKVQDFTTVPLQTCIDRDNLRTGKARVGSAVIQNMALRYGLITWPTKPIVIVDIDGTLANVNHRLHHVRQTPKNWIAFFEEAIKDPVNELVHKWVDALREDYCIVVVTGRSTDKSQELTVNWLHEKQIVYDYLFMRAGYDYREDWIVKSEILSQIPKDKIAWSIDDRWQVVTQCWRANGVKCYPVSDSDGDF